MNLEDHGVEFRDLNSRDRFPTSVCPNPWRQLGSTEKRE